MATAPNPVNELQAEVFKAIGHPIRLLIVRHLAGGERPVSEIVDAVGAEQSNVSRHLALLRQAGVLTSRKDGLRVYYRLTSSAMSQAVNCMLGCVEELVRSRLRAGESILAKAVAGATQTPGEVGG